MSPVLHLHILCSLGEIERFSASSPDLSGTCWSDLESDHSPRDPLTSSCVRLKTEGVAATRYPTQGLSRQHLSLRPSDEGEVGTTCMLHHAAQVSKRIPLTRTLSPDVWPCSAFTTVLRTAAARAWTRTAVRHLRTVSVSTSVNSEKENTSRTEPLSGVPSDINFGSLLNERKKIA
jgi:hypothetical protein